jgi:two-component system, chemotaxis family, chemotaxis protein CheY
MTRTCLVVDDSRVVRKVARRILEAHGFTVAEAEDGQKALDACHSRCRTACSSIGTCRS